MQIVPGKIKEGGGGGRGEARERGGHKLFCLFFKPAHIVRTSRSFNLFYFAGSHGKRRL